jgi:hypothetical protein
MNADYEHALLRLLSGEGERVRLEPAQAAVDLQRELRSANPNLSVYRAYAACDAWVTRPTPAPPKPFSTAAAAPTAEKEADVQDVPEPLAAVHAADDQGADIAADHAEAARKRFALAEEAPRSRADVEPAPPAELNRIVVTPEPDATAETPARQSVPDPTRAETARCAYCDSALPAQRPARFCPYCGADQTTRPCPACGEVIEPGWVFCAACGATAQ